MAAFCLTRDAKEKLRQALIEGVKTNGNMHPSKLADMTSEERRNALSEYVGEENAVQVNALFESKLLLKNQIRGMETWARKVTGISKEAKRDMISQIQKLDKVLSPADEKKFLHDLASTKLNLDVTQGEAKNIANLSKKIEDSSTANEDGSHSMEYGRNVVALRRYMTELRSNANRITLGNAYKNIGRITYNTFGLTKALTFAYDASSLFHQGGFVFLSHPFDWSKSATYAIGKAIKQFGGGHVMDEIDAKIISSANYDKYVKMKLAIGTIEDPLPSSLPEKIPLYGRGYKSTEVAFNGFLHILRKNLADTVLKNAEKAGINIDDKNQLEALGNVINSATGRGGLGAFEKVGSQVNVLFASPRNLIGDMHATTSHLFDSKATGYAKRVAAGNLIKAIAGEAAILGVATMLMPGSVQWDPRSTDFGKIKVGNQRFDTPLAAEASLVTLAARLLTRSSVSVTTGKVSQLDTGKFGSQTDWDVLDNFFSSRFAPIAGMIRDALKGKDFEGNDFNITDEVKNLVLPLGVQGYNQLQKDPKANQILGAIGNEVGLFSADYIPKPAKNPQWDVSKNKELQQFQTKVSSTQFNEAEKIYTTQLQDAKNKLSNNPDYKNLSAADKKTLLTRLDASLKSKIFKSYHFKYKPVRSKRKTKTIKDIINQSTQ